MDYKKFKLLCLSLIMPCAVIAQHIKVTGTTTGLADGTWLYLRPSAADQPLDSTQIANGKFSLVAKTSEKVIQMVVYTAKYTNYVFFWAEPNTHLKLTSGEFKKAIIMGSRTQDEANLRAQLSQPNRKMQDSLSMRLAASKSEAEKNELQEKLRALRAEELQFDKDYVKTHPNSLIAAYLLSVYTSTWGKTSVAPLYQNLSAAMKNTNYGKNILTFLTLNREIKIGGPYVDFEQTNTAGKKIKLSAIRGKYTLLEFWGSWCGPCRAENPNLVKTYNLYKDKGFAILGVAADGNKNQWLKAIKDDGLPWENVSDLKGDQNEAALIYGVNAFPTNYLIDENGIIIAKNLRGENLHKKLEELLK